SAINSAVLHELSNIYNKKEVLDILDSKNVEKRIEILKNECDIDISDYPSSFLRGIGIYKAPKVFEDENGQKTKHKWTMDYNIPNFVENKNFLYHITTNGTDIFRTERDLPDAE